MYCFVNKLYWTTLYIIFVHIQSLDNTVYQSWTILVDTTWQVRGSLATFGKLMPKKSPKWRSKSVLPPVFTWAQYMLSCCGHSCHTVACRPFRSPAKTSSSASGSASRWSKQEKELFEEGLVRFSCQSAAWVYNEFNTLWESCLKSVFLQAQFGRRWTKIAKLVGSRSILQVKSYARQYFKHKVRFAFTFYHVILLPKQQAGHTLMFQFVNTSWIIVHHS